MNSAFLAILIVAGIAFDITFNRAPSAHALINTESFVAIAFLILVGMRSRSGVDQRDTTQNRYLAIAAGLFAVILAAYWRILATPFLYDDYTHITDASRSTWHSILAAFGPEPHKPGLFYRPFGFLVYWLNFLWAGTNPRDWHFSSILLHFLACVLVYALCRRLHLNWIGSASAALIFALNACSVESVSWIDARFDPMTTCLVLATLVCVCDSRIAAACLLATCAMTSKEAAFCLPLLVANLAFFRPKEERRRLGIATIWIAALAISIFAYRFWALGGIGGYHVIQFHPLQSLNAIAVRDWTILFFPMNWSVPPGMVLRAFLMVTPFVWAAIAWWARIPCKVLVGSLAFTVLAALPVQHLLLLGTDLSGARIFYLLSVGWAILWGSLISSIPQARWRAAAIVWMVALHSLMLEHNLAQWLRLSRAAQDVCTDFARTLQGREQAVIVSDVPSKKDGVVFLHSGFADCVQMNGGIPLGRIQLREGPGADYKYDDVTGRIIPLPLPRGSSLPSPPQ